MKLKEYFKKLQNIIKKYPESLEYEVIMSSDDEGNNFQIVNYSPSLGNFKGEYNGDWTPLSEEKFFKEQNLKVNAVCIN
jgi:hypothetical protein